jgi:hypothetical protein
MALNNNLLDSFCSLIGAKRNQSSTGFSFVGNDYLFKFDGVIWATVSNLEGLELHRISQTAISMMLNNSSKKNKNDFVEALKKQLNH